MSEMGGSGAGRTMAAVVGRVRAFEEKGDADAILAPDVWDEAVTMWDDISLIEPMQVLLAVTVGRLHWYRYCLLSEGDDELDLVSARFMTEFINDRAPHLVSHLLRPPGFYVPAYKPGRDPVPNEYPHLFQQTIFSGSDKGVGVQRLGARAAALGWAYQHGKDVRHLVEAAVLSRAAVACAPAEDPARVLLLFNLALNLRDVFEHTKDTWALMEARCTLRAAADTAPTDHPQRPDVLIILAHTLAELFEQTDDASTLVEAVQTGRAAAAAVPSGTKQHIEYVVRTYRIGIPLLSLFGRAFDVQFLTEAVENNRLMLTAVPDDYPGRGGILFSTGGLLQMRFDHTGDAEALDEAVQVYRGALRASDPDQSVRAEYLAKLGIALPLLFERTNDVTYLAEAVDALRDAAQLTGAGDPDRAHYLSNLGRALRLLFQHTSTRAYLTEAVEVGRAAVEATPTDHAERSERLSNLGNSLGALYEHGGGEMDVLAEAVRALRAAADAATVTDRTGILSNLGRDLQLLFEHTGNTAVLEEAVRVGREAMDDAPDDHPDRARRLSNFGGTLQQLYNRTRRIEVLLEAVQVGQAAVDATPVDKPVRAIYLSNCANSLFMLFKHIGEPAVLSEAAAAARKAVDTAPHDHVHRAALLNNLSSILATQFELTGEIETLTETVHILRTAASTMTADHARHWDIVLNLGDSLRTLFEHTQEPDLLGEALDQFRSVGAAAAATVWIRITAYRVAAQLAPLTGQAPEIALSYLEAAIDLLPRLTPGSLARSDREHRLTQTTGLADQAVTVALSAGRPDRAVELLEQARGILVADALAARGGDLARLRKAAPELADAVAALRERFDALAPSIPAADPGVDFAAAGREAHEAWTELLNHIRALEGFEDFLVAPRVARLARQAQDGPVVFLTRAGDRGYALILTDQPDSPVQVVPLDGAGNTAVLDQVVRFHSALWAANDPRSDLTARIAAQHTILDVLACLWDAVTGPVLDALGHTAPPADGEWPRIWWCPVGLFAALPIHAAGQHADVSDESSVPRTVLDRVVSSYIPTVRSLEHARAERSDTGPPRTVIVAVPDAPDVDPLPGATAEVGVLAALVSDPHILDHPTRETVLAALPVHGIAHFACHGRTDIADPAGSMLVLADHAAAPLTVPDIAALHLGNSLAYLSACDTAVINPMLADEAVHITGAFHLAGYRHVIGTLWLLNDTATTDMVADFYSYLTDDGTTAPRPDRAAFALHHATRRQRARFPKSPSLWAAHTHTGT